MPDQLTVNPLLERLLNRTVHQSRNVDAARKRQVSEQFEAMFVNLLFSQLRSAMAPQGFFGESAGGEIFQMMMDQHFAEVAARRRQLGVARLIERYLDRSEQNPPAESHTAAVEARRTGGTMQDLTPHIEDAARETGLSVELLRAVIRQESGGDAYAVSKKGAQGVMQLMPETAAELGVRNVFDPRENILAGARYLRRMVDRFGNLALGLAAYNAGPGNVEKYQGIPPFAETQAYVRSILAALSDQE